MKSIVINDDIKIIYAENQRPLLSLYAECEDCGEESGVLIDMSNEDASRLIDGLQEVFGIDNKDSFH